MSIAEIDNIILNVQYQTPWHDDRIEQSDLDAFYAHASRPGNCLEKVPKTSRAALMAEFIYNAALLCATNQTNFEKSSAGPWQTQPPMPEVFYRDILECINALNLPLVAFFRTFATNIYNNMRKNNQWPGKFAVRGFTFDQRFISFPGATHIRPDKATPTLSDNDLRAINQNRRDRIKQSKMDRVLNSYLPVSTAAPNPNNMITID